MPLPHISLWCKLPPSVDCNTIWVIMNAARAGTITNADRSSELIKQEESLWRDVLNAKSEHSAEQ